MTRQARHALPVFDPSAAPSRDTAGTGADPAAPAGAGAPAAPPAVTAVTPGRAKPAHARHTRTGTVGAIAYLAVLVCTAAGVYIAWHQGSHGGGRGGVIAGAALLVAAATRLMLPRRLAGLLASRHRLTDVLTLTVFGAGLLVAGLVLPR